MSEQVRDVPLDDRPTSLGALIEHLSEQTTRLVRAEVALAKAELTEKATRSGIGAGLVAGGLAVLAYAFGVLIWAGVLGLDVVWPLWLSALVVGLFLVLVAVVLALVGVRLLKKAGGTPESVERVKADIATIKEGMRR